MKILGIETSCDETSASVVEKKATREEVTVYSNIISSSVELHAATGGIIPERAAREQIKYLIPVIVDALWKHKYPNKKEDYLIKYKIAPEILKKDIDAIAITVGPGLIGSLLVGVETAKTLAYVFNKPLIPVNHLLAHLYANFIRNTKYEIQNTISFPAIGLIVSGGHTDLLIFKNETGFKWLGGTRDDAAGEALDKIGRLLNLSYPAGAEIEKRASQVVDSRFSFKSPLLHTEDFDFSFSGLKTEVLREVRKLEKMDERTRNEICFATQKAIINVLVAKTLRAAQKFNVRAILLGGGVVANQTLRDEFELRAKRLVLNPHIFSPEKKYSTDNAAMIGAAACFHSKTENWRNIEANPELYFSA